MVSDDQIRQAAEAILKAETTLVPTPQLSRRYPDMIIEDAYRVQDLWAQAGIDQGAKSRGAYDWAD
jgi:2-oxo-hept-3-ene-1,7-dioate hydratase